jgi:large subunit ribosomal protein L4
MATKRTAKPKAAKKEGRAALDATVYAADGKKSGTTTLPATVFGLPWNADLVHQVATAMEANARKPWAHTKDRGEISGGGKKPWRQKGTGRARHGSSRSPIWRKGGVTHGPRNEKDYSQKVNKKMRVKALFTVLSKKYADGKTVFVSDISYKEPKTKQAIATMKALGNVPGCATIAGRRKNAAYVVLPKENEPVKKSFRNMGNVLVGTVSTMNPVDLLQYQYLVLVTPEECVKQLEAKLN